MDGMFNYYVPDDGDSPDHLNVFPLPKHDIIRLGHIKKAFPIPGKFHFRFKHAFEGTYVWLDIHDDNHPVPTYNGLVVSKISRIEEQGIIEAEDSSTTGASPTENVADLIDSTPDLPTDDKTFSESVKPKTLNDDLVGLLSDPVPSIPTSSHGPSNIPQSKRSSDPFNLFAPNNAVHGQNQHNSPVHNPSSQNFQPSMYPRGQIPGNAMQGSIGVQSNASGPSHRPMNSINTQKNNHIPHHGHSTLSQSGSSNANFNDLHWQGIGNMSNNQARSTHVVNPTNSTRSNTANRRNW